MRIEFVNHASTIFSHDGVHLITDPWIEGTVFHNGWSLLTPTRFTYQDYDRITHIWFSHEHPDHFFPPNIKAIPAEFRKNITVLYQFTYDKKVVEFCKNLGFKDVIELEPNREYALSPKFTIICAPFKHDSWLYIKTDEFSFLNTNDCVINTPDQAQSIYKITGKIDVFLTQFSYAAKSGNATDSDKRKKSVEDKINQMKVQFAVFKPSFFIPIASFVWFSHEENFYMNDEINKIDRVEQFIKTQGVQPVVLYPGDIYIPGQDHDNTDAIKKYMGDYQAISFEKTTKTKSVSLEAIQQSGADLGKRIKRFDKLTYWRLASNPFSVYLPDLDVVLEYSIKHGIRPLNKSKEQADLIMTSEVLDYCLRFDWGFGTTNVNARFQTQSPRAQKLFSLYTFATTTLNHNDHTFKRVLLKLKNKVFRIKNSSVGDYE